MARTALTITDTGGPSGAAQPSAVAVDAVNGNSLANSGEQWIEVINGSGGTLSITFITTATYATSGYSVADQVKTQATGTTKVYGPFDTGAYSSTLSIDWSTGTSVTVRAYKLSTTVF